MQYNPTFEPAELSSLLTGTKIKETNRAENKVLVRKTKKMKICQEILIY